MPKRPMLNKYTPRLWLLFIGAILLIITILQNKEKVTLEAIQNGKDFGPKIFRLSSDFLELFLIYIFCVSLYFAFLKYKNSNLDIAFIFIVIGVIFNPFIPFRFGNDLQFIIYFLTALFFTYAGYKELGKVPQNNDYPEN